MLERIRIVLVNTSHPGNIGSVARAMKTMGLSQLYLVSPEEYPHPKALEMASSADDVLANAKTTTTLDEAVADCVLVAGSSARSRAIPWPLMSPRTFAESLNTNYPQGNLALVFGRERTGLTNDELQRCHLHVQIPANPDYSSLNLAQAVQVMAYELRMADLQETINPIEWDYPLANANEMEGLYTHLQQVLIDLDFLKLSAPRKLMPRLRRLFYRAKLDVMEMNILRGILTAMQDAMKKE